MFRLSGFDRRFSERLPANARLYVVGGAVRDELLGVPVKDRDWVVVGVTAEQMGQAGFKPVGADFPVFLHPETQEEYALARTERKSGHGYKGFTFHTSPEVTLEEDLQRRDFTVNAMAMDCEGVLIDPYGGQKDLSRGVLKHVSPAFAEDPLRILRLARFLARFPQFNPHPETIEFCKQLVATGELAHLVPERVFAELNRGMGEAEPGRMWALLTELNVWGCMSLQQVPQAWLNPQHCADPMFQSLERADLRWSFWLSRCESDNALKSLAEALKVTNDLRDLALIHRRVDSLYRQLSSGDREPFKSKQVWMDFASSVDLFRKPQRLASAVLAFERVHRAVDGGTGANEAVESIIASVRNLIHLVQNGEFKMAQRAALEQASGQNPAEVVQQFKQDWLIRHLA